MLSGWGYALLLRALDKTLTRYAPQRRKFAVGAAGALLLAIQLPSAWAALNDTWQLTLPDRRNFLATWADGTLPASKHIANNDNRDTLNRDWGGYAGETRFDRVGSPLCRYHHRGMARAGCASSPSSPIIAMNCGARRMAQREFVTETTLLKSYPPSEAFRGPAMVVLLLQRIQHEVTGKLGPIRLLGYDLPAGAGTASAGQSLHFYLYWQAEAATTTNYQVFNHLLDAEGNVSSRKPTARPCLPSAAAP